MDRILCFSFHITINFVKIEYKNSSILMLNKNVYRYG